MSGDTKSQISYKNKLAQAQTHTQRQREREIVSKGMAGREQAAV
jgi:hypothetical protein